MSQAQPTTPNDQEVLSLEALGQNKRKIYSCRTFLSIVLGSVVGVFGLTGLYGFLAYFLVSGILTSILLLKITSKTRFFDTWSTPWTEGIFQGLLTYILFWTILYDIVHIYS